MCALCPWPQAGNPTKRHFQGELPRTGRWRLLAGEAPVVPSEDGRAAGDPGLREKQQREQ